MERFKAALEQEQQRINILLAKECEALAAPVRPVAEHILQAGGKRLRPLLTVFMGRVFDCRSADLDMLAVMGELVHMASLLHDDVYDNAGTRRGVASAHRVFGPVAAMLSGDAIVGHAARRVARLRRPDIIDCFSEAIYHTAVGEVAEFTRLGDVNLDYDAYLEIIRGKTAWALRAACEGAALLAGAGSEQVRTAAEFGMRLGIAFQIVDDALDIAPEEVTGKPAGGDIREGKCTPPVHFYWKSLSGAAADQFARKFRERSLHDAEVAAALRAMRDLGLDARTRELADGHLAQAEQALARLPAGAGRDILKKVHEFIRSRDF
jgi:octaprenyl-diphosphate synthase